MRESFFVYSGTEKISAWAPRRWAMVSNYRNQVYAAARGLCWKLPLPFAWKFRLRSKLFHLLNLSPQFPDYPTWIAAYDTFDLPPVSGPVIM